MNIDPSGSLGEILFTEEQIASRVRELASQITQDYQGKSLVVMSVLKGSVFFLTDITRHIDLPVELEFVKISTYKGTTQPQVQPRFEHGLPWVHGKNVLLVEDIVDTGETLHYAREALLQNGVASVRICVLLAKEGYQSRGGCVPDYIGFCIPNLFVVGYGLDYQERFRNLPCVAVLHQSGDGESK